MFKSHLEMIGRNETPSKKAKFWQSYVKSLKGSDDIRAQESPRTRAYRPFSTYDGLPTFRSIYDEPAGPAERITGVGYRYLPVHRDIYGYSPRPIYAHHYRPSSYYDYRPYDAEKAYRDHLDRLREIERRYPSRYGLYLKDKPNGMIPLEYDPDEKALLSGDPGERLRAGSVPREGSVPRYGSVPRFGSVPPRAGSVPPFERAGSVAPSLFDHRMFPRASSLEPDLDRFLSKFDRRPEREGSPSPTPVKIGPWAPRHSEVAYDADGSPFRRNHWDDLLNPRPYLPMSSITRDPWWWDITDLRPFNPRVPSYSVPPLVRGSYLSPIKRRYLWNKHPFRPLI